MGRTLRNRSASIILIRSTHQLFEGWIQILRSNWNRINKLSQSGLRSFEDRAHSRRSGLLWRRQQFRTPSVEQHTSPSISPVFAKSREFTSAVSAELDWEDQRAEVKCRMLEAIFLIAKEPLSARKLAALGGLTDPTQARTLARRLNEQYDEHGHAFRIEEVAGGLQLLTRPQFATWLRRLEHVPGEELLSQGMLETMAIVAYRQPILRAEIEAIRGVSSDEVLRQLMNRDIIRICGRHDDLGRPYLYGTTRRFLQLFGLQSLDSLPRAQKIRQAEAEIATRLAGKQPAAQDMGVENDAVGFLQPNADQQTV